MGKYEIALGQKINSDKTTIFFSKSVFEIAKEQIQNLLGILEIKENEKYLSLLAVVGRNKKASLITSKTEYGGITGVEREVIVSSKEGSVTKNHGSSYSHFCHELL